MVSSALNLYLHPPDFVSLCSPDGAEVTLGWCFFSSHSPHYTRGSCGQVWGHQQFYVAENCWKCPAGGGGEVSCRGGGGAEAGLQSGGRGCHLQKPCSSGLLMG